MANQPKYYPDNDFGRLPPIDGIHISRFYPRLSRLIFILCLFGVSVLFLPWIQTASGNGQITALHPEDRVQQIVSSVSGRVHKWYVRDGSLVKAGDKIAEIIDVDPQWLDRLQTEVAALTERQLATEQAVTLANSNNQRQKRLYRDGLASKREMEMAEITYQKALAELRYYQAQLIKAQSALARQTSQLITADRDGVVVQTLASSNTKVVKVGDVLASFLPDTDQIAVEVFISGNDVPLVSPGRKARLVFDGWPSIQFSGWPSVSIGTFGGIVKVVDSAASPNGLFRVLIVPDPNEHSWPAKTYLRMGAQVQAYIQLNRVLLGYEVWRQLNGFPVAINYKNYYMNTDSKGQIKGDSKNGEANGKDSKN